MSRRNRQLVGIVVIALALAGFAWGCGSSSGSSDTTTSFGSVSSVPYTPSGSSSKTTGTISSDLRALAREAANNLPQNFKDALTQHRPMVILFYVPGQVDDSKVLASIQALAPSFPKYAFLLYNTQDPASYGNLATYLQVDYPPEVLLISSDFQRAKIITGYQDQGSLNQELVNLGTGA